MTVTEVQPLVRKPEFDNLLAVLRREVPARPTLFEFFLNGPLYAKLAGVPQPQGRAPDAHGHFLIKAFAAAGYDYATFNPSPFAFPAGDLHRKSSYSANEGGVIKDEATLDAYPWPDPADHADDYQALARLSGHLPAGMKFIAHGPGGVLENVIRLVGYEDLCYLITDEPELVNRIFEAVGSRLVRHYELCCEHDCVGAAISNDDWGFKTQTMLAPDDMRRYVFPWHKRIVETIHAADIPAILHSCGNPEQIIDDLIDDLGYDGRHSYEDTIVPVEEAYERWGNRIAILGGIDVDFVCRSSPEAVYERSRAMLERSAMRGGYALGTGNSVPEYVPEAKYLAMIRAATGLPYWA